MSRQFISVTGSNCTFTVPLTSSGTLQLEVLQCLFSNNVCGLKYLNENALNNESEPSYIFVFFDELNNCLIEPPGGWTNKKFEVVYRSDVGPFKFKIGRHYTTASFLGQYKALYYLFGPGKKVESTSTANDSTARTARLISGRGAGASTARKSIGPTVSTNITLSGRQPTFVIEKFLEKHLRYTKKRIVYHPSEITLCLAAENAFKSITKTSLAL
uniref:TAR DNA-binding protein 43 N-terminal domain-containing protein n=1 Tax=Meloidogyne floridensis TaxID=298350 RepID=A0A915NGV2_9BILA